MPEFIISVLGGVVQDFTTVADRLPYKGETYPASHFEMQPGGKGSNSAVAIHRLTRTNPKNEQHRNNDTADRAEAIDVRVRMVGAVGQDKFGPELIQNLHDCGINVDGVRVLEGRDTAIANILVESQTGANSILQYPGANAFVEPEWFTTPESLGGGQVPHLMVAQLELNRDAIEQAIETAGSNGVRVLLNPSPAHYLMPDVYRNIAHLVMNETEAVLLADCEDADIENFSDWESITVHFHRLGVENVVVTLGEQGAYYSAKQGDAIRGGFVAAEKDCKVVDTSGAGYVLYAPCSDAKFSLTDLS
jgi:ribokinase